MGETPNKAPSEKVAEEVKPVGEGWVFEIRGYTYYHPEVTTQTDQFIRATLLKMLIERSDPEKIKNLPHAQNPDFKRAVEAKISHAFLYNVWEDKLAQPGVFRKIGTSLIDPLIPAPGAMASGMDAGMGGYGGMMGSTPMGPGAAGVGGMGGFGPPGVGGGAGGGSTWAPLMSGNRGSGAASGMGFPPGMGIPPGMGGGPGAPTLPSGGPGPMGPPMMGDSNPPVTGAEAIKVKPRYEFVIVFVWKEPAPSDALRKVTERQAPAAASGGGSGGFGMGGATGAPPTSSGGMGGDDFGRGVR